MRQKARMPLFHSVKMLFDDLQSIQSGLSGFGSEIVQFQKALSEVEQGYSLFLLDEFARGTNPDEGAVIVQAVTRYLNGVDAISLLTTHYDKVAEYARTHYQIIGLRDIDPEAIRRELAVTSEDGVAVIARHMNYGLYRVEGKSDCPRDALNICRMLSLKPEILKWWRKAIKKRLRGAFFCAGCGHGGRGAFSGKCRNTRLKFIRIAQKIIVFSVTMSLDKTAEKGIIYR